MAHTIHPRTVYTIESAAEALGLKRGTLPREIRLRRLRAAKRAGKVFILGAWLLEWVSTGERRRNEEGEAHAA